MDSTPSKFIPEEAREWEASTRSFTLPSDDALFFGLSIGSLVGTMIPHFFALLSATLTIEKSRLGEQIFFRVITLSEPPKFELLPFLVAERNHANPSARPRRVALVRYQVGKDHLQEAKVDLIKCALFDLKELAGKHSHTDAEQMQRAEAACLADAQVQAEIKSLELPKDAAVCVEPWTYGTDGMNDMSKKIIMCYFYMRIGLHEDSNHYAYPLDLCVELSGDLRVIKTYRLPSGVNDCAGPGSAKFDRRKIHNSSEYHPELQRERREGLRPLNVVQPDGTSFQTEENLITWEKWRLRIGFNYREGLTLHDVTYDGRSLFYRLSLSEMFVPYGDSRSPYPRKAAFDLGNDGAGLNANSLKLGCDCFGSVKYFDFWHHTMRGEPIKLSNVVCCHEVDDGILWKHTNYRTGNAVVVRSRVLVIQTIITVSNYEYIFAFQLHQDASINYEVRATGILSTAPIDIGDSVPYGTIVAPGVMAPYHQHLFSLRIDPAIDGQMNSLVVEESHPMPLDDSSIHNPFGVGYTTSQHIIDKASGLDLDATTNRIFKIVNENALNPTCGSPVGYRLVPHYSQMLLAHPSSFHARRSEFAEHAIWITKYEDNQLFSAGEHTMQSSGGEGIASWVQHSLKSQSVRNEDIVIWHTFGTTHNPRVEDWPVMPCEKMIVGLKPVNFFTKNPAMDVQLSSQACNRSMLVSN